MEKYLTFLCLHPYDTHGELDFDIACPSSMVKRHSEAKEESRTHGQKLKILCKFKIQKQLLKIFGPIS